MGSSTSHHDSPLSRINRLQLATTLGSWIRQPSMFRQSQPLPSSPGSSSFSRDADFIDDAQPSSRSSGHPRERGPSSQQEDWESSSDRLPSSYQGESGASRYPQSQHEDSQVFTGPPTGDDRQLARDPRLSRSFHSDARFQAQEQNWDSGRRSFSNSAPVSTSSPSRGFTGSEYYPPLSLPQPLTTRKPYGELPRKVFLDLKPPSPSGRRFSTYNVLCLHGPLSGTSHRAPGCSFSRGRVDPQRGPQQLCSARTED